MANRDVKDKKRNPGQTFVSKAAMAWPRWGITVNPISRSETVEGKSNKLKTEKLHPDRKIKCKIHSVKSQ